MSAVVRMPQLAAGGTEATIQGWLVVVGDTVEAGQAIVEIETEKAVVEHETEVAGVVAGLLIGGGETAAVGSAIAVIAEAGETAEQALTAAHVSASDLDASDLDASDLPGTDDPASSADAPAATTVRSAVDAAEPAAVSDAGSAAPLQHRVFASPLVRRLAREHGLDLAAIAGSGPNGRVVRRDVDELVAGSPAQQPGVREPAAQAPPTPASTDGPYVDVPHTDIPHSGMRRAIARRLVESKTTIPHFTLTADCRVDELIEIRARVGETTDAKPSVNDFVLKAVAAALVDVPEANAIWTDDAIRRFHTVDLAVAVSVPDGLVTPVVRGVERMPLGELSSTVRDIAERGRSGRLKQHELEGGSFSVSNLGMYGTRAFSAIINPPHSGILAVGAAERRPVVEGEEVIPATVMTVTLSADHRVLDGALAARWLAAFVTRIENPLSLLL